MENLKELCSMYLGLLRTAYLVHQQSHWQTHGINFYGNHLLFQRLYENAANSADAMSEKIIGTLGEDAFNSHLQAQIIGKLLLQYSTPEHLQNSLKIEQEVVKFSKKFYNDLKENEELTLGADNLIMSVADKSEEAIYLLQQALKNGDPSSKKAARISFLHRIKNAATTRDWIIELQQELLTHLMAIVPSYIPGQYNTEDIKVSVNAAQKQIFGNVKLSKQVSPELQKKIEDNFRNYASSLLPNNANWTIGIGFAIFPIK